MTNVNEILRDHLTLTVDCMDRMYLNGYIPNLQVPGQLVNFLTKHRGNVIPSPILLGKIGQQFQQAIQDYAQKQEIPLVHFESRERKDELAAEYRSKFSGAEGVVFIGVAQEKAQSFKSLKSQKGPAVSFEWSGQPVRVNHYYFYLQDADFGPAFIKICSYIPYAIKVYLNGHEWAKQQLHKAGIAFESLDNGFLSCQNPDQLQALSGSWKSAAPRSLTIRCAAGSFLKP